MAKSAKKNGQPPATDTAAPVEMILQYGDWKVNPNDLPAKSVYYLLQNGFSQSLVDAAAFTKEQKAGKSPDEVAEMARKARQTRYDAILAGTVGARVGGPKLPQIDRVMREIAEERLQAIAAAKGVAMPKGDTLKASLTKIISRDPDGIRAEAQHRIDSAKLIAESVGDADADLFAEVAPAQPTA